MPTFTTRADYESWKAKAQQTRQRGAALAPVLERLRPAERPAARIPVHEPLQPVATRLALTACPACTKDVSTAAVFCPHCGHPLQATAGPVQVIVQAPPVVLPPQRKWNPGAAAVLSFFMPGLGQMYKGQVANGLVWLALTIAGYAVFILPGIVLHLCCIAGASMGDPTA